MSDIGFLWRVIMPVFVILAAGMAAAPAAVGHPTMTVTYRAPLLTVEARDVRLADVLREIGAQVGFSVVADGVTSPVSISVRNVPVEDALRRLLAAENYTLLYRGQPGDSLGVLDQIVLFGAASPGLPAGVTDVARPASPVAPPPAVATPPAAAAGASRAERPGDSRSDQPTAADVLRAHAAAALRAAEVASGAAGTDPATTDGTPGGPGRDLAEPLSMGADALAVTTQRAQQSLKALVDALATATRSLQQEHPHALRP